MLRTLASSLALITLLSGATAFAAAGDMGTWEVSTDLGLSVDLTFNNSNTQTTLGVGRRSVESEVGYNLGSGLEVVLQPVWEHDFSSNNMPATNALVVRAGVNYSFMPDVKNSVFAEGLIGLAYETTADANDMTSTSSTTVFTWAVGAGKRFALSDWATYRPEIMYAWLGNLYNVVGDQGSLQIMPVAFSFYF